jgi:hypothetical protein
VLSWAKSTWLKHGEHAQTPSLRGDDQHDVAGPTTRLCLLVESPHALLDSHGARRLYTEETEPEQLKDGRLHLHSGPTLAVGSWVANQRYPAGPRRRPLANPHEKTLPVATGRTT